MRLNFRPICPSKRGGFTLIELSVGLTLWVVVTVSLTRLFQSGLRSYRRAEEMAPLNQEARVVLDQIAREFRNSIDVPGISWPQAGRDATFATVEEVPDETAPASTRVNIEKVTYQIVESQDSPEALSDRLPRTRLVRFKQELSSSGVQDAVKTAMTSRPTTIVWDFAYASPEGGVLWRNEWKAPAGMARPCGIRVHLTLLDGAGDPEIFTRTVFLATTRPLPRAP